MATFHIHKDIENVKPRTKNISKIPKNVAINKNVNVNKNVVAKEAKKIPLKRLPLRSTNNILSKDTKPLQKKPNSKVIESKTQICQKSNSVVAQVEEKIVIKEVVKKSIDLEILKNILHKENGHDKENTEHFQDSIDRFYFSVDRQYLISSDYHDDIFSYLLVLERALDRPKYDYMLKQPELTYKMRSVLVDWLSAVTDEYNLQPQTIHLAVTYVDCFLSRMSCMKTKFQLVGTAAMMIAAKYEEIYPPDIKEWVYLTADSFTSLQLRKMEKLILKVLNFNIAKPTTYSFISHMSFVHNLSKKIMLLAMYFSELVLLEGEEYIQYYPSQLASAAIALARHTLYEEQIWPKKLVENSGYSLQELCPLIKKQYNSFQKSQTRSLQAIQDKYQTVKYGRVSLFKPRILNESDFEQE